MAPSRPALPARGRQSSQYGYVQARQEKDTLSRGPLYGLLYCLAGVGVGFGAHAVGGWVSLPIWLVAVLLFVAGVWTALFTGGWLLLVRYAQRRSGERPSPGNERDRKSPSGRSPG
jgi:hypothetical protein